MSLMDFGSTANSLMYFTFHSSSASDPGSPVAKDAAAVSRETGEVLYTEVDPNSRTRTTEQVEPGPVYKVHAIL